MAAFDPLRTSAERPFATKFDHRISYLAETCVTYSTSVLSDSGGPTQASSSAAAREFPPSAALYAGLPPFQILH